MLGKDVLHKTKRLCDVLRHDSQIGLTHFWQMINSVIWLLEEMRQVTFQLTCWEHM